LKIAAEFLKQGASLSVTNMRAKGVDHYLSKGGCPELSNLFVKKGWAPVKDVGQAQDQMTGLTNAKVDLLLKGSTPRLIDHLAFLLCNDE